MHIFQITCHIFLTFCAALLLAACGQSSYPPLTPEMLEKTVQMAGDPDMEKLMRMPSFADYFDDNLPELTRQQSIAALTEAPPAARSLLETLVDRHGLASIEEYANHFYTFQQGVAHVLFRELLLDLRAQRGEEITANQAADILIAGMEKDGRELLMRKDKDGIRQILTSDIDPNTLDALAAQPEYLAPFIRRTKAVLDSYR